MEEQCYTVIYNDRWKSGSQHHSLTKFRRVNKLPEETVADVLEREGLTHAEYIFIGCPKQVGEE
jgi:hypothetical protein